MALIAIVWSTLWRALLFVIVGILLMLLIHRVTLDTNDVVWVNCVDILLVDFQVWLIYVFTHLLSFFLLMDVSDQLTRRLRVWLQLMALGDSTERLWYDSILRNTPRKWRRSRYSGLVKIRVWKSRRLLMLWLRRSRCGWLRLRSTTKGWEDRPFRFVHGRGGGGAHKQWRGQSACLERSRLAGWLADWWLAKIMKQKKIYQSMLLEDLFFS